MPKKMTTLDKAKIELTMHRFDFEKAHDHMVKTNWKWASDNGLVVPDLDTIRDMAWRLLEDTYNEGNNSICSTGGFTAEYRDGNFKLCFVVFDSDSYVDGEEDKKENIEKEINNQRKEANRNITGISSIQICENNS